MSFTVQINYFGDAPVDAVYELTDFPITIGRDSHCDIKLDGAKVSRNHARIILSDDSLFIYNEKSRNGVRVNGQKVEQSRLENGSMIDIGDWSFSIDLIQVLEDSDDMGYDLTICEDDPDDIPDLENYKDLIKALVSMHENIDSDNPVTSCLQLLLDALPVNRLGVFYVNEKGEIRDGESLNRFTHEKSKMSRTFTKKVIKSAKPILLVDAHTQNKEEWGDTITEENINSIIGCPITTQGRISAVILCENLSSDESLHEGHLQVINLFGNLLNAIFQKEVLKKLKRQELLREKEFLAAKKIQEFLFNQPIPQNYLNIDWALCYEPALHVGGDFYAFYEDPDSESIYWILGDVAGKGVGAAMIVSMIKAYCSILFPKNLSPSEFILELNESIHKEIPANMFFTCVIIKATPNGFSMCNAGHNPSYLMSKNAELRVLKPSTIAVALGKTDLLRKNIAEETFVLEEGSALVIYTDGTCEAQNSDRICFGDEPFLKLLQSNKDLPTSSNLIEKVLSEIKNYRGSALQSDDITMLIAKK